MPINPNIALSFQAPQISDPLNKMAQIEQIKAYRQNALAKEREAQLVERELESMNALRKLYATGQSPTFEQAYALGGQKGADVFATQAKAKEAQARQTSAERKALMDTVNIGRTSLAATPDDPAAYGQWRQSFISQYPEMEAFFPSEDQYLPAGQDQMGTKRQLLLSADQLAKDENALSRLNAQLRSQQEIAAANRAAAESRLNAQLKSKEQIAAENRASAEERNKARIAAQRVPEEKITDWKSEITEDGNLQYFSPSTGKVVQSTGRPIGRPNVAKRYEINGVLVDENGNVIYESPPQEMTPYQQALVKINEARADLEGQRLALQKLELEHKKETSSPEYKAQVLAQEEKIKQSIALAASSQTKNQAKDNMKMILDNFQSSIDTLHKQGEIISTKNSPQQNLYAMAANSKAGQLLGKTFGTMGQQARQSIEKLKPIYMTLLSQATGMTAQQLNSNVEFKAFMDSIAGPDTGYEVANQQIDILRKLFTTKVPSNDEEITDLFFDANRKLGINPKSKPEGMPSGRGAAPETSAEDLDLDEIDAIVGIKG